MKETIGTAQPNEQPIDPNRVREGLDRLAKMAGIRLKGEITDEQAIEFAQWARKLTQKVLGTERQETNPGQSVQS